MSRTTLGIILVVLGIAAFIVRQITYKDRDKVLDLGNIEATAETNKRVDIPGWVGGVLLAAGVVLVIAGAGQRRNVRHP